MKEFNLKIITSIILIICVIVLSYIPISFNEHKYIITVTSKERIINGVTSKYVVFGDDENNDDLVFENTDNMFRKKFNSSNIQSKLKIGNNYEIITVGYRIPLLSMYENIIKIKKIGKIE